MLARGRERHARVGRVGRVLAAPSYALSADIEYAAIREAAALIDVSPLFKYRIQARMRCA